MTESNSEMKRPERGDSEMRRPEEKKFRNRIFDSLQPFSSNERESSRFEVTIRNLDHPAFPPAYRAMKTPDEM